MERTLTETKYQVIEKGDLLRKEALAFMEQWAQKWHKCSPPETEGTIIAALSEGRVVGTVALDFRDSEPFPLERIYPMAPIGMYFPDFERKHVVQGGRWFSSVRGSDLSRMLLHAIAEHSMPKGIRYLLAEVKPHSFERIEELGILFPVFYGLFPSLDRIDPLGLNYYTEAPTPRLMVIRLDTLIIKGLKLMK